MADAWETLVAGSTIPAGDAWEHLNAQGGGAGIDGVGPSTAYVDLTGISADAGDALSATVTDYVVTANMDAALSAEAAEQILTTEVCP